ncbi:hypothetical protein AKJ09_00115 [Labilithrix luteola]|uniref:IgGFc-binding protein N-terminal domain-containing protein n=1 Tax=Labilithrix luteola TaxID=1391654 RepID=A0A0K1PJ75_9BACT|nr:IgGFc-binding protein [Labilithrix luteola]AKU93451.1 hypothetical protein AKJ09_00115 [Labilithrix luteola]
MASFIRSSSLRIVSGILGVGIAAAVFAACSSRETFETEGPPPFTEAGAADAGGDGQCGFHCSRDLKQVLVGCEGEEQVAQQCTADQGCGEGRCVDACSSAELSKGSAGCDFWTVPPDTAQYRGGCFAAMIANTWDRPVSLSADFGSEPLDISQATYTVAANDINPVYTRLTGPLAPGEVAVVFLAHDALSPTTANICPPSVTPAMTVDPVVHGTGRNKAFHLKTDAPVSAYSIYPYGGAASMVPAATLLLPVSSWTKDYMAVAPFDFGETGKRRTLQIVANQDDTEVRMTPTTEIVGANGVLGATTGVTQTWTLAKGETLQFAQRSLSGSPIETNKPVGLFGGAECTELPTPFCDTLQQQIPPFAQWGSEYAVAPFKPRIPSFSPDAREQVPYTIVGAAPGTTLTYEPSRPRDAPETLETGQIVSFITDQVFVVKSQDSKHPFHVNVYMTGANYGGGGGVSARTLGDPDFVNVPPVDQYLDRYVFFTDFTFPETALTIVRKKTATGFEPVELACGGEVGDFQPLGSSGLYEFAWVKLTSGFVPQTFPKGTCGYGRHEARSKGAFAITVWGTAIDASYGYVGGTGLRPINDAKPPVVR